VSSTRSGDAGLTSLAGAAAHGEASTLIGPYRILTRLGEGGMGVVYLAEQTEPVQREVAIKLLRDAGDSHGVIARFQAERQALAVMDHPGITKVFDAGTTATGRPYFVMERVQGLSITQYALVNRLDLRRRLRLFVQVCHAVQHAHQKGIIHRDLKPSNVLVTEVGGEPLCKVIDFGVAKAIAPGPDSPPLTVAGSAVGTPAYMSPEQGLGSGLDVDTRTDIYSLGMILYELLVGAPPFDSDSLRSWVMIAQHVWDDLPAPSVRFAGLPEAEQQRIADEHGSTPAAHRRELRGDLDAIVLKALEKEREQRYPSAAIFASDVEHFLAHEPVTAATTSGVYRARKFARRHRVGMTFTTVVALMLVTFAVSATVQARNLAKARRTAVARQGQAEELSGFMLGDLRASLSKIGRLDLLDAVATRALAYFAAVPEAELSDEELFRRTVALRQLGEVRFERDQLPEALEVFERSLTLADGLVRRDSTAAEWRFGLGASHFWVGYVHYQRGEYDEALAHFEPYLRIADALVAQHPDSLAYRLELAQATSNLGSTREVQGALASALDAYQRTVALKQDLVRRDSAKLEWRLDLAQSYNTLAVLQRRIGKLALSAQNHRLELALERELVQRDTANATYARYLAITQSYLGDLLVTMGDLDQALALLHESARGYQRLTARDTTNVGLRRQQANVERLVGGALLEREDVAGAEAALSHALGALQALPVGNTPSRTLGNMLLRTQASLAEARALLGRASDALPSAAHAVAAAAAAFGKDTTNIEQRRFLAEALLSQGTVFARAGNAQAAGTAWSNASRLVDADANANGQTDLLAIAAAARLQLGDEPRAGVLALSNEVRSGMV
jgi:eukaryotic-like serine/threonine-protein kinase